MRNLTIRLRDPEDGHVYIEHRSGTGASRDEMLSGNWYGGYCNIVRARAHDGKLTRRVMLVVAVEDGDGLLTDEEHHLIRAVAEELIDREDERDMDGAVDPERN